MSVIADDDLKYQSVLYMRQACVTNKYHGWLSQTIDTNKCQG